MNKTSKTFFKTGAILQLITAAIHSISLFVSHVPANDTERHLNNLMNNYKMEAGAGFTPTFANLFTSMSACFSLLLFFAGVINLYVLRNSSEVHVIKGILNINLVVFAVVFTLMLVFTFLPPIICTGLIFAALVGAKFSAK